MNNHQGALGFHIRELSILLSRKIDHEAIQNDIENISHPQAMVIHFISRNHPREIHQKDIEEELSIRKPTASQLLDRMEKSGLVERRVSSKDKRRNQIILTDKAIDSVKQIKHVLKDIEKTLQQDLTEDEIATFLQVVEKMKKNIQ